MSDTPIDLRSDTVTRPTLAMRQAMVEAEVGDDVYGEDPTVNLLQERVAALLGKEKGLFFPSGTMCNQAAIGAHTRPGEEVICDRECHIFHYEQGAASRFLGVQLRPLAGEHGLITAAQVRDAIRGLDVHEPITGLITLENTHNRGGGVVYPQQEILRIAEVARQQGVPLHLDGARLLNASVASGLSPAQLAAPFDTVYFCLSKGLGCPAGSVLAGPAAFIVQAARLRKALGGGMRQIGFLAAAGLYALDHHVARLADDHRRAHWLARQVGELDAFRVDLALVHTNIVMVDVEPGHTAAAVAADLAANGVRVSIFGPQRLRLVTHLEIDDRAIERAVAVFKRLYG